MRAVGADNVSGFDKALGHFCPRESARIKSCVKADSRIAIDNGNMDILHGYLGL
jgi:hypothetical protein